jgi:hypothetical protein
VDFTIDGPDWGVEIIRDGNRISEHIERFNPGGLYYPWIQSGQLKDWIILDCRNTSYYTTPSASAATASASSSKLWRVIFTVDYAMVDLWDSRNLQIDHFGLAN